MDRRDGDASAEALQFSSVPPASRCCASARLKGVRINDARRAAGTLLLSSHK
jgi:hypothetical protein